MENKVLLEVARNVGFSTEESGFTTAHDGEDAVLLPKDVESLERLEEIVPTLRSVEIRFHNFVVRA